MLKNILLVGAGGIGSWTALSLSQLYKHNQLPTAKITIADDDDVDVKNLSYQFYSEDHVFDPKVDALYSQFPFFTPLNKRITDPDTLLNYDLVISAVDNTSFRKLMFNTCIPNNIDWIDSRAEGRSCSLMCSHKDNTLETMLKTIPKDKEDQSCQRGFELENGIVQTGNRIAASLITQSLLNWYRGEPLIKTLTLRI